MPEGYIIKIDDLIFCEEDSNIYQVISLYDDQRFEVKKIINVSGKQDKLSTAQMEAANSGVTAEKVGKYDLVAETHDVVDSVATHDDLDDYDTSALDAGDIVRVVADEEYSGKTAYYRFERLTPEIGGFNALGTSISPYTQAEVDTMLAEKQHTLTAGANITISGNVISATGSGGTTDYEDLSNKPKIEGATLRGNLSLADIGAGTYSKPSGGIPKTDLASAVQTSLGKADSAYQKPSGGVPESDLSAAVQQKLNGGGGGDGNCPVKYIDLSTYGITEGDIAHKAPYSASEWKQAYDNYEGIKAALNAMATGKTMKIVLPKGTYVVCYQNMTPSSTDDWTINIPSGVTFDLGGSLIRVIYDSVNRCPYDLSSNAVYALTGNVFGFSQSKNAKICNGEIKGDRYERAFSNTSEKSQEQSYGVRIHKGSRFCEVENLTVHGFMGDAVAGLGDPDPDEGKLCNHTVTPDTEAEAAKWADQTGVSQAIIDAENNGLLKYRVFLAGELNDSGVYAAQGKLKTGYVSRYISLDNIYSGNMLSLVTNLGYDYELDADEGRFKMCFYDEDLAFISASNHVQCDNIPIPAGAAYVRVSLYNKAWVEQKKVLVMFQITPPSSYHFTVKDCKIYNCHRGGMSNLVNDTVIEDCELFENGTAGTEGFPLFPDTTRYAINCEDFMSRKLTIKDCRIHDGFNGILLNCIEIVIDGLTMNNFVHSTVSCKLFRTAKISNSWFRDCESMPSINAGHASDLTRTLTMTNNFICTDSQSVRGNTVLLNNLFVVSKIDIENESPYPISYQRVVSREQPVAISKIIGKLKDTVIIANTAMQSTNYYEFNVGEGSENVDISFTDPKYGGILKNLHGTKIKSNGLTMYYTNTVSGVKINEHQIKGSDISVTKIFDDYDQQANPAEVQKTINATDTTFSFLQPIEVQQGAEYRTSNGFYSRDEVRTSGTIEYVFENCRFTVTNTLLTNLFYFRIKNGVNVKIKLVNCVFENKTANAVNMIAWSQFESRDTTNYSVEITDYELIGSWVLPTLIEGAPTMILKPKRSIDNTPTSGSDNLVTSGGIYTANAQKEAKGKITVSGTEYSVTRKAMTITNNGTTTTYYVADIT